MQSVRLCYFLVVRMPISKDAKDASGRSKGKQKIKIYQEERLSNSLFREPHPYAIESSLLSHRKKKNFLSLIVMCM